MHKLSRLALRYVAIKLHAVVQLPRCQSVYKLYILNFRSLLSEFNYFLLTVSTDLHRCKFVAPQSKKKSYTTLVYSFYEMQILKFLCARFSECDTVSSLRFLEN